MPLPFYRELVYSDTDDLMKGNDVVIAQTLLDRDEDVSISIDGVYGENSAEATKQVQRKLNLDQNKSSGIVDAITAQALLDTYSNDNYKDSGFTAASMGYKYKFHIPVHSNRSIETISTLYDAENGILLEFKTRQHGYRDDGSQAAWPDFGDGDAGLNQFSSGGNTVTGLVEVDLNSPEDNPQVYGPWPVNRIVRGLAGNALTLLPNIRDGLLIHTGNWSTDEKKWTSSDDMPNSSGCIHAHPEDIERIYKILTEKLKIVANNNPYSGKNYPYQPQGIAVIELID